MQKWFDLFKKEIREWSSVRSTAEPEITNVSADFSSQARPLLTMTYADEENAVIAKFPDDIHATATDTFMVSKCGGIPEPVFSNS